MDNGMEIESSTHTIPTQNDETANNGSGTHHDASEAVAQAITLLQEGLWPFIKSSLYRALGEDFAEEFLPGESTSASNLLRFIDQKWIGVFSDSVIADEKNFVSKVYHRVRASEKTINPLPERDSKILLRDIERLLTKIRATGPASEVAQLLTGKKLEERIKPSNHSRDGMEVEAPQQTFVKKLPAPTVSNMQKPLIVLDGSNIAFEHGKSNRFSPRGIVEAYFHYLNMQHPTVIFLPRGRLKGINADDAHTSDDSIATKYLRELEATAALVLTPEGEYDDTYALYFAKRHGGLIVSNDKFKDMLFQAAADGKHILQEWEKYLRSCRIGFTFHGHDFMQNPHFDMARATKIALETKSG